MKPPITIYDKDDNIFYLRIDDVLELREDGNTQKRWVDVKFKKHICSDTLRIEDCNARELSHKLLSGQLKELHKTFRRMK